MSLPRLGQTGWGGVPLRNPLPNPLVWPCSVEVFDVFLDYPLWSELATAMLGLMPRCLASCGVARQGTRLEDATTQSMVFRNIVTLVRCSAIWLAL
jgi:hypothetical protein